MLGMIEINLLPQEYRVQERTPLALFLTIVAGIIVVGGIGVTAIRVRDELLQAQKKQEELKTEKAQWEERKKTVEGFKAEIATAQRRQMTIIEISQSKIMFSQKLCQFGKLLADYPGFWIDRLGMSRGGGIETAFTAVADDLNKIAEFREAVTGDTSFWYHFKAFDTNAYALNKDVVVPSGIGGPSNPAPKVVTFSTRWALK